MLKLRILVALVCFVAFAAQVGQAQDLSGYRDFRLGEGLSAIAKQIGTTDSEAKVIHQRPALIQELNWRPNSLLISSPQSDSVNNILFSFYNGELCRILVE